MPAAQPYASAPFSYNGTEQLQAVVSGVNGQDAVVDWVLLELYAPDTLALVAQRAAVLQRDGDVVDAASGKVVINFPAVTPGAYRVGLRHRNHQSVLTATAPELGPTR
ncbi:MAG: hypothetical protein R3E89_02595 [Thiolinea sp.]